MAAGEEQSMRILPSRSTHMKLKVGSAWSLRISMSSP
jgi:hypothetical protein